MSTRTYANKPFFVIETSLLPPDTRGTYLRWEDVKEGEHVTVPNKTAADTLIKGFLYRRKVGYGFGKYKDLVAVPKENKDKTTTVTFYREQDEQHRTLMQKLAKKRFILAPIERD